MVLLASFKSLSAGWVMNLWETEISCNFSERLSKSKPDLFSSSLSQNKSGIIIRLEAGTPKWLEYIGSVRESGHSCGLIIQRIGCIWWRVVIESFCTIIRLNLLSPIFKENFGLSSKKSNLLTLSSLGRPGVLFLWLSREVPIRWYFHAWLIHPA